MMDTLDGAIAQPAGGATPLSPQAVSAHSGAHQAYGWLLWREIATAPLDGSDVLLLAHGMIVEARYCPGEWSEDTPLSPREYDGAVWSCFDDQFQFEIEEVSHDPAEWCHGPVTHWAPKPLIPGKDA
jgi:hypothetical protein